jgi:uncharacterized membrane protein
MSELDVKINELELRLETLVRTQIDFQVEITAIRKELARLRSTAPTAAAQVPNTHAATPPRPDHAAAEPRPAANQEPVVKVPPRPVPPPLSTFAEPGSRGRTQEYFSAQADRARSDLERFIGENLISKVGILILILGVGIGAKYAIDNELISPLARIVLGYLFGFGLLGLAGKLKAKYHNFSAVLLSGALAIMYFITYFAYSAYQLIGQGTAFPLMVILTAFGVACAVLYNRQVIAHVGLVGAYAVPFLLSNDSGRYGALFTYMSVVNAGILAISVRKYWKPIFYTASIFTWLIFGGWIVGRYDHGSHFGLALFFLAVFASIFYATKLAHARVYPDRDVDERTGAILGTAVIFYLICLAIADNRASVSEYTVLFAYVGAAAAVILVSSWWHAGKVLLYLTYPATWAIFGFWFARYYSPEAHFILAAAFAGVYFALFYAAGLIYKLLLDDLEDPLTVGLLLTNSFVFYGFTMAISNSREASRGFEGLITVGHAALHGVVSQIVSRVKANSVIVIQALTVLVLTFSTIAIPIQFDGNVVTIVWSVEAAALFAVGRLRRIPLFEYFSYPLMAAATLSLTADWIMVYSDRVPYPSDLNRIPVANGDFISALVYAAAAVVVFVANRDEKTRPSVNPDTVRVIGYAAAGAGISALYNAGRLEVSNFHYRWFASASESLQSIGPGSYSLSDIGRVDTLAQIIYSALFVAAVMTIDLRKARSRTIAFAASGFGVVVVLAFLTIGMLLMHELRVSYMAGEAGTPYTILIRYAVYAAISLLVLSGYAVSRDPLVTEKTGRPASRMAFEIVVTVILFVSLSAELLNLIAQFSLADGTKFGLSILWGAFALGMVAYGIAFDRKYQRVAAISLLAVTLAKLFFYDIADLGTIPKTILFITLGILLLIVSFLYNKYKSLIFPAAEIQADRESEI